MKRLGKSIIIPASIIMMLFLCFLFKTDAQAKNYTPIGAAESVEAEELPSGGSSMTLDQPYYYVNYSDYYTGVEIFEVTSDVTIILPDGVNVSLPSKFYIRSGKSLKICGEGEGTGTLSCSGIYGSGGGGAAEYTFIMDSGNLIVTGPGSGADSGIGSTQEQGCSDCSIIVNGGTLTVGAHSGVALGSSEFGSITINGGVVTANATGANGIGIFADTVTINGGQITASGDGGLKAGTLNINMTDFENDLIVANTIEGNASFASGYRYAVYDPTAGEQVVTAANIASFANAKIQPMIPGFKTQSITLDGTIKLNLFAYLPGTADYSGSTVTFTINEGNPYARTVEVSLDAGSRNEEGYYKFTLPVQSVEMGDAITAVFNPAEACGVASFTLNHSITAADYCKELYNAKKDGDETAIKQAALAKALFNYGFYAQEFLSQNALETWTLNPAEGEKGHTGMLRGDIPDLTSDSSVFASVPEHVITINGEGITKVNYSAVMDSGIEIRIFVETAPGVELSSVDTTIIPTPEIIQTGEGSYEVPISAFNPKDMSSLLELNITASDSSTAVIKVSPLSYAKSLMENETYGNKTEVQKSMLALFEYYTAAKDLY